MDLEKISLYQWEKYWASSRSLLSCSYWGYYYTHILATQFGMGFQTNLIISKQGYSTCFFDAQDRQAFGNFRVEQMRENWPNNVSSLVEELKHNADTLMELANTLSQHEITVVEWQKFIQQFFQYIGLHISPRNIIDYLNPDEVAQVKDMLAQVRLYTEPVYEKTEHFVATMSDQIGLVTGYKPEHIRCLLKEEIEQYFAAGILPDEDVLAHRYASCALWWNSTGEHIVINGKDVSLLENRITTFEAIDELKGMTAHPGKVSGRVRIVFKPDHVTDFAEGDILVTSMTRPEFLPLMKKAAAIVTDAGGILCHAAITAREIGKPCLIGTKVGTKLFKDGEMVEVDATNGWVRKQK